ncbi:DNA-directed RNA polymerase subunit H [Candidatus Bathyarchaeota archaeon]|nr:DNA-directed RNA polymerase subunit H [Candidatus Bathyarchaeota archaeon]
MASLKTAKTLEEKRAALIIKYRKIKVDSVEKDEDRIVYRMSRGDEKYIMHVLLGKKTIGIAYIRELRDKVNEEEATGGLVVGDGKYTYSARSSAPEMRIELIPPTLPTFDIFEHDLVPLHEVVSQEERKELSKKYHAEPFQFPWIKSVDPISIILGAKPGDVVRITQKSETAGKYETYRYVV